MKKILLITTGGTIASSDHGEGLTPKEESEALTSFIASLECVDKLSLMNIDSTNMRPKEILEIARTIGKYINDYDGFVITHGTDTMAYTASALSYLLEGIGLPVILTGAQIPIEDPDSDARENLYLALKWARSDIRGVYVTFSGKLIRGSRAHKADSLAKAAFISPGYPINNPAHADYAVSSQTLIEAGIDPSVFLLKLFPGLDEKIFDFLKQNYKGIVIEAYGLGGIPDYLGEKIEELLDEEILIALTTQCLNGGVKGNVYEVGKLFNDSRVIDGKDMTSESLLMKMMVALDRYPDNESRKEFIETSIEADRSEV